MTDLELRAHISGFGPSESSNNASVLLDLDGEPFDQMKRTFTTLNASNPSFIEIDAKEENVYLKELHEEAQMKIQD